MKTRELLTFSMLFSLGGCEPQLKGHMQGNLNVGNRKETLLKCCYAIIALRWISQRSLNAIRCINEVIPE